jgi:hypothetical protein
MVKSEELIGTTEYLTLYTRHRINRCRYNRDRLNMNSVNTLPLHLDLFNITLQSVAFLQIFRFGGLLCTSYISSRATSCSHLILFHFTIAKILVQWVKLWNSSFSDFLNPHLTSSRCSPDIIFNMLSKTSPTYVLPLMWQNTFDLCHGWIVESLKGYHTWNIRIAFTI